MSPPGAPDVERGIAPAKAPDPDAAGAALADRHGTDDAGIRDRELGDVRPRGHGDDARPRLRDRGRLRADPARPGGGDPVPWRRTDRVAGFGIGPAAAVGADQRIAQPQAEDQQQPDDPGDQDQPEPVVLPRLGDGIGVHPADVAVRARPGRRDAAGDGRRPERQRRRREHVDVRGAVGRVDQLVEERLHRVAGRPEVALEAVPRRHRGQPLIADVVERQVGRPLRAADDDRRHDRREEQHGDQQPDARPGAADESSGRGAERRDGRQEPVEERHHHRVRPESRACAEGRTSSQSGAFGTCGTTGPSATLLAGELLSGLVRQTCRAIGRGGRQTMTKASARRAAPVAAPRRRPSTLVVLSALALGGGVLLIAIAMLLRPGVPGRHAGVARGTGRRRPPDRWLHPRSRRCAGDRPPLRGLPVPGLPPLGHDRLPVARRQRAGERPREARLP